MNAVKSFHFDLANLAKMKILAVDDEPSNVALLEAMLEDAGYSRVKSLTNSRIVMETCAAFDPDLVLLDLMMPQPDGFAILESLRAANRDVFLPVVVLTADINEESRCRALAAGATDFLLKPFDQTEVLLRIRNLLEMRGLHLRLDNQRAAFEDAVYARASELRQALTELEQAKNCPVE